MEITKRSTGRLAIAALGAAALTGPIALQPSAEASPIRPAGHSASHLRKPAHPRGSAASRAHGRRCVVVLDKLKPGQKVSSVVSRKCGNAAQTAVSDQYGLLMTAYWDVGYGGDSIQFFGRQGPCDNDGYGIPVVGYPDNDNISSFTTDNNCNFTNLWQEAFYYGQGQLYPNTYAVPYVGDTMNDDVASIRLWHI